MLKQQMCHTWQSAFWKGNGRRGGIWGSYLVKQCCFLEKNDSVVISKFIWVDRFPISLQNSLRTTPGIHTALLDFKLRLLSADLYLHQTMQEPFFKKHHISFLSAFAYKADVIYRDGWAIWLMRVSLNVLKSTSTGKISLQEYRFYHPRLDPKGKADINRQCSRSRSVGELCWGPSTDTICISGYFIFGLASAWSHGVNAHQQTFV